MKASSAWHHQAQQQQQQQLLDAAPDELAQTSFTRHPNDASENHHHQDGSSGERGTGTAGRNSTSRMAPLTSESCVEIVGEARARMELEVQTAPGTLAPTRLAEINEALTTKLAEGGSIRALIFGGAGGRITDDGGGSEHEEILQFVSLMLQLSSSPARSELTYASHSSSAVEAARSVVSSCANELGIADGRVRVDSVRSTLNDFLRSPAFDQPLDYMDVGGPLSWSPGGRNGNEPSGPGDADADAMLHAETLKLIGPKLAPGGCLRAWAFASNPFTELAFRAAAKMTGAESKAGSLSTTDRSSPEQTSSNLLDKILRTTFGAGINDAIPMLTGGDDEEWVRQAASVVLAGGDRLSVPDIDEVLAGGGFELALRLGENATELGGKVAPAWAAYLGIMEEELVEGGLSRWEIADFADSLEVTPKLVHQVLAVWRGGGSNVALPQ